MTPKIRRATTGALSNGEAAVLRRLVHAAFGNGNFSNEDWEHAKGGIHVIAEENGVIVSHASVVPRTLEIAGRPVRTGYVEGVATWPRDQGRGFGTHVMQEIGEIIRERYEIGALSTSEVPFYARLGWTLWRGPTAVRTTDGIERTPDDDGGIMILPTPSTPPLNLDDEIVCEWREGDVW